jgi:hypothetical protein
MMGGTSTAKVRTFLAYIAATASAYFQHFLAAVLGFILNFPPSELKVSPSLNQFAIIKTSDSIAGGLFSTSRAASLLQRS